MKIKLSKELIEQHFSDGQIKGYMREYKISELEAFFYLWFYNHTYCFLDDFKKDNGRQMFLKFAQAVGRAVRELGDNENFYNKYTPKEQNEEFGIKSVHFEPFEDMEYVYETEDVDQAYDSLEDYVHSTVYEGYRYFFKDLESLKKFCEMAENGVL